MVAVHNARRVAVLALAGHRVRGSGAGLAARAIDVGARARTASRAARALLIDDIRRRALGARDPERGVVAAFTRDTRCPVAVGLLTGHAARACQMVAVDDVRRVALLALTNHRVRGSEASVTAGTIAARAGASNTSRSSGTRALRS